MPRFIPNADFREQEAPARPAPMPPHFARPPFPAAHHPFATPHDAPLPPPPPPHARAGMTLMEFDEHDMEVFKVVFRDEDTAVAATEIVCNAPHEVQLLAIQALKIIEKGSMCSNKTTSNQLHNAGDSMPEGGMTMKVNFTRWANPVLNDNATEIFEKNYGEYCHNYMNILYASPYEIAVISILLAYIESQTENENQTKEE